MIWLMLLLLLSVFLQNASFTLVSRARNTKSIRFHAIASFASNGMYLLVIRQIVTNLDSIGMQLTYLFGSVAGSVFMHWLSMTYFEKKVKT